MGAKDETRWPKMPSDISQRHYPPVAGATGNLCRAQPFLKHCSTASGVRSAALACATSSSG